MRGENHVKRLTVDEIAQKLARHPELVRRWLREGRLRGERIGWSWTITSAELDRFKRKAPGRRRR
jgi:excisionase family DNA binding protein